MNSKDFIQALRKVIREEVQTAVRTELSQISSVIKESRKAAPMPAQRYTETYKPKPKPKAKPQPKPKPKPKPQPEESEDDLSDGDIDDIEILTKPNFTDPAKEKYNRHKNRILNLIKSVEVRYNPEDDEDDL